MERFIWWLDLSSATLLMSTGIYVTWTFGELLAPLAGVVVASSLMIAFVIQIDTAFRKWTMIGRSVRGETVSQNHS